MVRQVKKKVKGAAKGSQDSLRSYRHLSARYWVLRRIARDALNLCRCTDDRRMREGCRACKLHLVVSSLAIQVHRRVPSDELIRKALQAAKNRGKLGAQGRRKSAERRKRLTIDARDAIVRANPGAAKRNLVTLIEKYLEAKGTPAVRSTIVRHLK